MGKKNILKHLRAYQSFGIEYIDELVLQKGIQHNKDLPHTVENLCSYIHHCDLCELSKRTKGKSIGFGNIYSDIYIVGVNCDFENEQINTLLNNIVQNVLNLKIEDIYLTNLIKCQTAEKLNESDHHIELCKEYFIKQVDIIKPKYIVALGEVFRFLMENNKDTLKVFGNCYRYRDLTLIPMYDLEFVYKNPSYKENLYKDLKKFKIVLEKK